ncbi:EVE domain-containing protein [Candidatus Microgenomates bacterium]|nr:EVE domain-containing protein [Candidatus Microgenomates bacterium]
MTNYWLMKTEPAMYSIDTLQRDGKTQWDGVRNYQARNNMKNMAIGDMVLFYHSITDPGVYGIARVCALAHPDTSQFDPNDEHFDPKNNPEKPMWWCVDVEFVEKLKRPVSLETLKSDPRLEGMVVRTRGSRLSVQPVSKVHFEYIRTLGNS